MIETTPVNGSAREDEPILRPEARVVRADRSLAAMVLVVCTLGGMGIGFGFAMYLMRAQLAFAPSYAPRAAVYRAHAHSTWLGVAVRSFVGRSGTVVVRVDPDTGAQAAGMRPGDVVTTFEGDEVRDAEDFSEAVAGRRPGEVVQLGVERNGQPLVLTARLGQR
jgi:S1-C subfamily serine protease